jgi:hypothetical protein
VSGELFRAPLSPNAFVALAVYVLLTNLVVVCGVLGLGRA